MTPGGRASPGACLLAALPALAAGLVNLVMLSRSPLFFYPVVDAAWHHAWAGSIASGNITAYAPYFRAPLYPLLLGGLYAFTGPSVTAGALLSTVLHAISAALLFRIASGWMPRGAAAAAAVCWGLWGTAVAYSSTLLIEPLYIVLILASFLFLDEDRTRSGMLFLGLAAIARPGALAVIPALLLASKPGRLARGIPLFLAPVAAVWAVNALAGDAGTVISSQGGINLYIGNGPEADGFTAFAPAAPPPQTEEVLPYRDNVEAASFALAPPGLRPSEVSAWWVLKTLEEAARNPGRVIALLARKAALMFATQEIPCNYDGYYLRRYSPLLSVLLLPVGIPMLVLWALLPGAVASGRPTRRELFLASWLLLMACGVVAFFVTARFRLPLVPFALLLLAARAVRYGRRSLILAPVGIAAGIAVSLPWRGVVERSGVNMPFHDALAHCEQGQTGEARALFLEAIDRASGRADSISLNRAEAMLDLAVLEAREGRTEQAARWLEALESEYPGFIESRRPGILQGNTGPPGRL
ncbi:hypothetical protein GX411_11045 [Candidatus Fermentibacteria bacterium]|nr:hypothetical protein [Candidatus Fermentibacteria bacterium]